MIQQNYISPKKAIRLVTAESAFAELPKDDKISKDEKPHTHFCSECGNEFTCHVEKKLIKCQSKNGKYFCSRCNLKENKK